MLTGSGNNWLVQYLAKGKASYSDAINLTWEISLHMYTGKKIYNSDTKF